MLCAERACPCLWAYSNLGILVLHRNFLFFVHSGSHLNCIFSYKANAAFPCNKPNKIKYQEEICWRKTTTKIFVIVYFSLVKLSPLKSIATATSQVAGTWFLMESKIQYWKHEIIMFKRCLCSTLGKQLFRRLIYFSAWITKTFYFCLLYSR